jgi:hypothetical protein
LIGQSGFTALNVLVDFVEHPQELSLKIVDGPNVGRNAVYQSGTGAKT